MRLIGKPNGVRHYPQMIKSALPKKHKYGADVTWSAHTDTFKPTTEGHGVDAEINAFKNNLQITILVSPTTDGLYQSQIEDVLATGRMSAGIYFRTTYPTQEQVDFFHELTGGYAAYWSYANGLRDHDDFTLIQSLVTRNSSVVSVDYDFETRLSQNVASLFNYNARDLGMATALTNAETALSNAISSSGWYNDFSHWHWAQQYGDIDQLEQFFSRQRAILDTVQSVTLGAGEAVEYMWLRKLYKRGGIYQDGNELVLVSDVRNDVSLPIKTINTSLSVEVDVSGTILDGKEITANADVIKKSPNLFIVQVPYIQKDGFRAVRLLETLTPSYLDLSLPQILSVTKTGSTVTVTTDKPTNVVLFGVPVGGRLYQATIVARSNIMANSHEITVGDVTGVDVYVGAITKNKQSALSVKYTL